MKSWLTDILCCCFTKKLSDPNGEALTLKATVIIAQITALNTDDICRVPTAEYIRTMLPVLENPFSREMLTELLKQNSQALSILCSNSLEFHARALGDIPLEEPISFLEKSCPLVVNANLFCSLVLNSHFNSTQLLDFSRYFAFTFINQWHKFRPSNCHDQIKHILTTFVSFLSKPCNNDESRLNYLIMILSLSDEIFSITPEMHHPLNDNDAHAITNTLCRLYSNNASQLAKDLVTLTQSNPTCFYPLQITIEGNTNAFLRKAYRKKIRAIDKIHAATPYDWNDDSNQYLHLFSKDYPDVEQQDLKENKAPEDDDNHASNEATRFTPPPWPIYLPR